MGGWLRYQGGMPLKTVTHSSTNRALVIALLCYGALEIVVVLLLLLLLLPMPVLIGPSVE